MPLSRRTQILIGLAVLALLAIGALTYYFVFRQERVVFSSYVCEDDSYFFVLRDKDAIEVAGKRFALVSEDGGARYEGDGPVAYILTGDTLRLIQRESGEPLADCTAGEVGSAPIMEIRN